MMTNTFSALTIGWVAIATGIAGVLALAFIILLFTVGQPFGFALRSTRVAGQVWPRRFTFGRPRRQG